MQKSIYELAGGEKIIHALAAFYRRVLVDPVMLPLFANPRADHAGRMAFWLIEEFGGPAEHSQQRGGRSKMVSVHDDLKISDLQREHWIAHMLAACEEVNTPHEFMEFFESHIQFETEMAQKHSWGLI